MAHRPPHSSNHFSQNATHPSDQHNLDSHYQTAAHINIHVDHSDHSNCHSDNPLPTPITTDIQAPLRVHVERVVREYFALLGDEVPTGLYELILKEVELPLLTVVLEQTRGNQTKCAQILGLNRGTLRKKMKTYDLM